MIELILGGARSGKSRLAEQHAVASGLIPVCIATAEAGDAEMQRRIEHHRSQRSAHWQVVEEPVQLASVLRSRANSGCCIVVDCLTLWLTNLLCKGDAFQQINAELPVDCPLLHKELTALLEVLPTLPGNIILVSNEIGLGVVPMGASTRLFVDEQGRLNQALAGIADRVTFVAAGLPLILKG